MLEFIKIPELRSSLVVIAACPSLEQFHDIMSIDGMADHLQELTSRLKPSADSRSGNAFESLEWDYQLWV
jgi:hypothetical protein